MAFNVSRARSLEPALVEPTMSFNEAPPLSRAVMVNDRLRIMIFLWLSNRAARIAVGLFTASNWPAGTGARNESCFPDLDEFTEASSSPSIMLSNDFFVQRL